MSTEIYQDLILQLHKHPKHEITQVTGDQVSRKQTNPLCGDEITIAATKDELDQQHTGQLQFIGDGCAISRASAALLTTELSEKPTSEALATIEEFLNQLATPFEETTELSNRDAILSIRQFPARCECAALAWKTARELITANS